MNLSKIAKNARIVIVGAGPAGLSAAYYLNDRGFKDVTVLEKLGRVGGLCRSITEDGFSFDLGANYITPAYKRVIKIAKKYDAKMYGEHAGGVLNGDPEKKYEPSSIWDAVRGGDTFKYLRACAKFAWLRWKLSKVIDAPGFAGIHERPELCIPFCQWLAENDLECLTRLFEVPITIMGYGYIKCPQNCACDDEGERALKEISAPYALKYMKLLTFISMVLKFTPLESRFHWPKRFEHGYQRLWERVSFDLDVRLNIDITRIERNGKVVSITFTEKEQVLNSVRESAPITQEYDYLILACPLSLDVLGRETASGQSMLDLRPAEAGLFEKIVTYSYALTSCSIEGWKEGIPRILCTIPPTEEGSPWAITRQTEGSELTQFYVRLPGKPSNHADKTDRGGAKAHYVQGRFQQNDKVAPEIDQFIQEMGWRIMPDEWQTYDCWPYFQHVPIGEICNGFFSELDKLQGVNNTYYTGSLLNFELVENVMEYSEHIVDRFFVGES